MKKKNEEIKPRQYQKRYKLRNNFHADVDFLQANPFSLDLTPWGHISKMETSLTIIKGQFEGESPNVLERE